MSRELIAKWVFSHQKLVLLLAAGLTVFFAAGLKNVQLETIFSDLLPRGHEYAETFRDHSQFGNPLTYQIVIERTDGIDIFNHETLQIVWDFTRDIGLAPAVDHDQIVSITTEKARYAEAVPDGIHVRPLMGDRVPESEAEIAQFRERLERSPVTRDFMVAQDAKSTIITAAFHEHALDYLEVFEYVKGLANKYRDGNHEVYVAGVPAETGWIHHYQAEMMWIFVVTMAGLILALAFYMRNLAGVVTPLVAAGLSAVWGFGFAGWVGQTIEPLLLLVPLLLVARAFSHCVQFTERFYEIAARVKDRKKAGEITMRVMMGPGTVGVVTDSAAIFLIAIAPIPAIERFALFCGFWMIMVIPTVVLFAPLLLTLLPPPGNLARIIGAEGGGVHQRVAAALKRVASITIGGSAKFTAMAMGLVTVVGLVLTLMIRIGNPVEGSPFLWEDDAFNTAVRYINSNYPGVNTLEIIFEEKDDSPKRLARTAEPILTMLRVQDIVERFEDPPRATLSFGDYLMEANRLFQGGNPKWLLLDPDDFAVEGAAQGALMGTSPLAYSHVVDFELRNASVSMWYRDNVQETVDRALAHAHAAVEEVGADHEHFRIRVGTGVIALQEAVNDTVKTYYWIILSLLILTIFVVAAFAYKSVIAALILLVPTVSAKFMLTGAMHAMGLGLDINSLMVAAIGVGVGIDYGIYLLSRICEEYHLQEEDLEKTIISASMTSGRAILFTASIMLVGILPWYFLSGLKFLADMGLLLSIIMVINMVTALIMLPLLVWFLRPEFIGRSDHFAGEAVDASEYDRDLATGIAVMRARH